MGISFALSNMLRYSNDYNLRRWVLLLWPTEGESYFVRFAGLPTWLSQEASKTTYHRALMSF